jgi:hypothetical protein
MSLGTLPLPESPLASSPLLFNNYDQTEHSQFFQTTTYMNEGAMPHGTPPSRESPSSTTAYSPIIADLSPPTADEPSYYPESPSLLTPFYFSPPPPPQESIMYSMHDEPLLQDSPVLSQDNNQQPLLMAPLNFVGQEWLPSSPPEPGTRASLPDSDHDINSSSTEYFPNSSMSSAADKLENTIINLTVQSNNCYHHIAEQQNNEEQETDEGPYQEYHEEEEEEDPLQELGKLLDAQNSK